MLHIEHSNAPVRSTGLVYYKMYGGVTSERRGFAAQPVYCFVKKYPMHDKHFIALVQYGDDISLSRLYFHSPLARDECS